MSAPRRPGPALLCALLLLGCGRPGVFERPPGVVERFLIAAPEPIPDSALTRARRLIHRHVEAESFPGAAYAFGNRELIQHVGAEGRLHWDTAAPHARPDSTLYDLASLTKVVATTAAVMALVNDGRMELDAPVRRYLPAFSGGAKDSVTLRHLLTHTGGVRAGAFNLRDDVPPGRVFQYLVRRPLALSPGEDVLYSDLGFVLLWAAAERAAGEPLSAYLRRRVWGPLAMRSTAVGVPVGCASCAPTLHLEQGGPYAGGSYDEVGRRLGGVGGNAGAFSTAQDLARFAAMIANEGRLGNVRIYSRRTVRAFLRPQPGAGTRALGWEAYCREGIVPDQRPCRSILAVGHTGVTGTSLWLDPATGTWAVLLTNRSYLPRHELDMQRFRRRVFRALLVSPAAARP